MSPTTAPAADSSYAALGATPAAVASRVRDIVPWVVILVLGALALIAAGARSSGEDRFLDPRSAGPSGSRALAEVLRANGVDVRVVTVPQELPPSASAGTTVVATADDGLDPASVRELVSRANGADRLVVLISEPAVLPLLEPHLAGVALGGLPSAPASGCAIDGIRPGDVVA